MNFKNCFGALLTDTDQFREMFPDTRWRTPRGFAAAQCGKPMAYRARLMDMRLRLLLIHWLACHEIPSQGALVPIIFSLPVCA